MAGREFQKHFGMAENGQLNAGEWLAKCYRTLGLTARRWFMTRWSTDGPRSRPRRHVAGRDRSGRGLSRRFWECLNMLAAVYLRVRGGSRGPSFIGGRLLEMSNFCCLPGRAGGPPLVGWLSGLSAAGRAVQYANSFSKGNEFCQGLDLHFLHHPLTMSLDRALGPA